MALIDSIVVTYIRIDNLNVLISALDLFNFYFIHVHFLLSLFIGFNPLKFMRLYLVIVVVVVSVLCV